MGKRLKILVVDDSTFMRKVVSDVINNDPRFVVVGEACNGEEGLALIDALRPDAVTLDLQMPVMDGLTMLGRLDAVKRPPIVILSSLAKRDEDITIQALEQGAFDFVLKPDRLMQIKEDGLKKELTDKLFAAAKSKIPKDIIVDKPAVTGGRIKTGKKMPEEVASERIDNLVAIGTSTGGPRTLRHILEGLPKDLNAAILIVQHMPAGFTKSLADRLNENCSLRVKEAEDGERLKTGHVYIAPGDRHMMVVQAAAGRYTIKLDDGPTVNGHKPAVDVMLMSLTDLAIKNIIGVILTGMGSDGAKGIKKLSATRQIHTIAQNKESCVVYGMPKSIVELGLANQVLHIDKINEAIAKKLEVD